MDPSEFAAFGYNVGMPMIPGMGGMGGGMPGFNAQGGLALGGNSPENSIGGGGMLGFMSGGNTPQDRGFGISAPTPMQPYYTGGGLNPGNPYGYESTNLSQPGTGEQFFQATGGNYMESGQGEKAWDQYGGHYSAPGQAENFYQQNQQKWTGPGARAQAYANNQGVYNTPGTGETTGQNIVDKYGFGGTPKVSQNSQDWWKQTQANMPRIDTEAGLDPYYKNAEKRSLESLSRQQAARGVYGSTAALNDTQRAITDLNAERANREADYNLRAIGEQRAWAGLGGQLAGSADQNSLMQSQNEMNWMNNLNNWAHGVQDQQQDRAQQGLNAAFGLDSADLAGLNAGWNASLGAQQMGNDRVGQALAGANQAQNQTMGRLGQGQQAAMGSQSAQQGRSQQLFENNLAVADRQAQAAQQAYENMFREQQQLLDSAIAAELGLSAEALNQSYRTQQGVKDDSQWLMDMASGVMGGFGGGGGGGAAGMLGGLLG